MANPTDLTKQIGKALKEARLRRGLVMREVANGAGVQTGAVANWERGANALAMENLVAVAKFLRIDPVRLSRGELSYLDDGEALSDVQPVSDPGPVALGPLDVKVVGVSVGGEDEDFSLNGEVTGYVRRPPGIASLRNVFALHVLGDSMSPRYEAGDLIYCGGREPVPGDDVVIEMFPEEGGAAGKAFLKRLVRRTGADVVCKQFNPEKEVRFNRYEIKAMHRLIPVRELLGY